MGSESCLLFNVPFSVSVRDECQVARSLTCLRPKPYMSLQLDSPLNQQLPQEYVLSNLFND